MGSHRRPQPCAAVRCRATFVADDGDTTLPRGLTLSPDGRTLAVGHSDGTVDLIGAQTLRRRRSLRALRGFVAAYSPDGRLLAVACRRGQVTFCHAPSLPPARELRGSRTVVQTLASSPTAIGSPSRNRQHACRVANRDLTPREWQEALPGKQYRTVCRP